MRVKRSGRVKHRRYGYFSRFWLPTISNGQLPGNTNKLPSNTNNIGTCFFCWYKFSLRNPFFAPQIGKSRSKVIKIAESHETPITKLF